MHEDPQATTLTILIPCYNEARRVEATVEQLVSFLEPWGARAQVVLVDDASTDQTWPVLQHLAQEHAQLEVLTLPSNRGKGGALAAGAKVSTGDVVIFFDADLSYALDNVHRALAIIESGADVVIGARDLGRARSEGYSPLRSLMSATFNQLVNALLSLDIVDTQCGFKAFRGDLGRALFASLEIERFGFDVELLFLTRRWGLRLERMPIEMVHQEGSTVSVVHDSLRMVRDLVRIRHYARLGRYPDRAPV